MSTTGLEIFDTTFQKTHIWLNDVMRELGWEDERPRAYLGRDRGHQALVAGRTP
ncbi:MAG: hypothetical protein HYZ72_14070 [Deltaproteobacteria bacterium]|nr:hypothetical protein [Deltaproteobacteria bacterium]